MKNIIIEGHRGYCSKYPENTLISFEAAMELGVDAFEFDVWLTADKVPVIMHDGNARRTCGVDRHLRDMTLAEAKRLEPAYTEKFGDKYVGKGLEVPTLREVLELCRDKRPDIMLGVEIKEYTEETVEEEEKTPRTPKVSMNPAVAMIDVCVVEAVFPEGATVNLATLKQKGVVL